MSRWSNSSCARRATRRSINVYPAAAITKGFEGREMTEFGLLREAGAVALTEAATPSPARW